ncbi:type VI secretion system baseplate subunit TssE [Vibrio parahaemolyticus]|uniref:type VI secretion system baseplate subunit TssE n=1 Tax=Vibrio parahaemolyticus TaxID=670 RepID=UPI00146D1191|nr:type VI secretion system baseplate subunit TssE [Vibrio parahaemolyticus]MDF5022336.1 type VI secretion system baseplate subunit TssE [Vibrio parahaemolyticus]MDF5041588.1 type VI secretion system baseplate subunit TssE [Vibrio parahaemolyticus]MDF5157788.1 type VI secretion system baseplate subunit TssE [Vibrio parahaemolyticus]MDF5161866.1 type VI secretion system baseplate subunit TssE [Vibrio parahaemolyticus]MDF5171381.1 type VI secretion system baseplate subunit TssE [Vibrio parahaemo
MNGYIAPEEQVFGVAFLDRLDAGMESTAFQGNVSLGQVVLSVKDNLMNVLNTREGSAQSAPLLGLVDFNDANLDCLDLAIRIKQSIQTCIKRFEPRLSAVSVSSMATDNPLDLSFTIEAQLNSEALHDSVRFQILLDKNQQYRVL